MSEQLVEQNKQKVLYFTDVEGTFSKLESFVDNYKNLGVTIKNKGKPDEYIHIPEGVTVIFGGDLVDRGPDDIRLMNLMYNTAVQNKSKAKEKQKFVYIAGNRDINKERFNELNDANIQNVIRDADFQFWGPPAEPKRVSFGQYCLMQYLCPADRDPRLADFIPESIANEPSIITTARQHLSQIDSGEYNGPAGKVKDLIAAIPVEVTGKEREDKIKAIKTEARVTYLHTLAKNAEAQNFIGNAYAAGLKPAGGLVNNTQQGNELLQYQYLLWMTQSTMGMPDTVKFHKEELNKAGKPNTPKDVLNHFKDLVKPDGIVTKLLAETQLFYTDGDVFAVHGTPPENWVLPNGDQATSAANYCDTWNKWYKEQLALPPDERAKDCHLLVPAYKGGKPLNAIQLISLPNSSPTTGNINVKTEGIQIAQPKPAGTNFLAGHGVKVVLSGHQPEGATGQIKQAVSKGGVNMYYFVGDTNYYDDNSRVFCCYDHATQKLAITTKDAPKYLATTNSKDMETTVDVADNNNLIGTVILDKDNVPYVVRHADRDGNIVLQHNDGAFNEFAFKIKVDLTQVGKPAPQFVGQNEVFVPKHTVATLIAEQVNKDKAKVIDLNQHLTRIVKEQITRLQGPKSRFAMFDKGKVEKAANLTKFLNAFEKVPNGKNLNNLLNEMGRKRTNYSFKSATSWSALTGDLQKVRPTFVKPAAGKK